MRPGSKIDEIADPWPVIFSFISAVYMLPCDRSACFSLKSQTGGKSHKGGIAVSFLQDFKKFALRGNVMDMAVGVVIGASFGKIVSSFVSDILMPPVGLLLGKMDFSNLFLSLGPVKAETLAQAKEMGVPVLSYGLFLNTVIDFLIQALVIFIVIRQMNKFAPDPPQPKPMKDCPFCLSSVDARATRCPDCTSELPA